MGRLGERLSTTDGSTMQTYLQCAIGDKRDLSLAIEAEAAYLMHGSVQPTTWDASPVGGGLLP